ncbi:MAG: hypothetical protein QXK45_04420 [Thermofilaceae archaeon]
MVRFRVDTTPIKKVKDMIPSSLQEIAKRVARRWDNEVKVNFAVKGRPPWPPLSPKTIEEKLMLGYPLDPLIRTYEMYNSFTFNVAPTSNDVVEVIGRNNVFYAIFHEYGTDHVPARPFLNPELVKDQLEEELVKAVVDVFGGLIE